jgi:Ser/Thr protein kinase RdoA (MazF antagonist)
MSGPSPSSAPSLVPGELAAARIVPVLADSYGLRVLGISSVPLGLETVNFSARTDQGSVFVKAYPHEADLVAAERRIGLSQLLRTADIPFPVAHRSRQGRYIARRHGIALSVWDWVDGASLPAPYTPAQAARIGTVLGRLHVALAGHPRESFEEHATRWWAWPTAQLRARGRELLARIEAMADPDEEDKVRHHQIEQRIDELGQLDALQAGLPTGLRQQLVHSDATRANMLWRGPDHLVGLLDPSIKVAFPTWELGRAAYELLTVAQSAKWPEVAAAAVAAYTEQVPSAWRPELVYAPRLALLHNLGTWWGVEALYEQRLTRRLRRILAWKWQLRFTAAHRMLHKLNTLEGQLTDIIDIG